MKTIHNSILLLAALFSCISFAQIPSGSGRLISAQDLLMSMDSGKFVGSPYLDENLSYGTVLLDGNKSANYYMRYNVLNDQIEFGDKNETSKLKAMPNDPSAIFILGDAKFQYLDFANQKNGVSGIFEIIKIYDQENLLVRKYTKSIRQPEEKDQTSYSPNPDPKIVSKTEFYFVENGNLNIIVNNKKRALKSLDDSKQKELKKFIKNRDINFDDNGKGLAELIAYYRNIK
jgi:hypothetical protein